MSAAAAPQGKAVYAASRDDRLWLLSVQRKLYIRSQEDPDHKFEKLWGLIIDPRNLRTALDRVHRNRGARTAGVDGLTVRRVLRDGSEHFVEQVRGDLRAGTYRPMLVRRVLIPKAGKPGKSRPLGIPTVSDRVIQAAVKNILEPIYEAPSRNRPASSMPSAPDLTDQSSDEEPSRRATLSRYRTVRSWLPHQRHDDGR
jgi:retron-type reverse transcriptase